MRKYIIGGVVTLVIILVAVLIIVLGGKDSVPEEVLAYCEKNEDSLICQDPEATKEDVVYDMFRILKLNYNDGYSDEFCDDFFYGNVANYCKLGKENVFPEELPTVRIGMEIIEIEEDLYSIQTYFNNNQPAYNFRIGLIEDEGYIKFYGFAYSLTDLIHDLHLLNEEVSVFMVDVIKKSDDLDPQYCVTYYGGDALVLCEDDVINVIPDASFFYSEVVVETGINEFLYLIYNQGETLGYQYTMTFIEIENELIISEIEFIPTS
ncbi:hypothetical protein OAO42_01160 [Candidatus Izimaplasma bacterium]|nr:hypothetical protein [Candidatus Izimaplasma bacterium]